jgi:hypothetical protein
MIKIANIIGEEEDDTWEIRMDVQNRAEFL